MKNWKRRTVLGLAVGMMAAVSAKTLWSKGPAQTKTDTAFIESANKPDLDAKLAERIAKIEENYSQHVERLRQKKDKRIAFLKTRVEEKKRFFDSLKGMSPEARKEARQRFRHEQKRKHQEFGQQMKERNQRFHTERKKKRHKRREMRQEGREGKHRRKKERRFQRSKIRRERGSPESE